MAELVQVCAGDFVEIGGLVAFAPVPEVPEEERHERLLVGERGVRVAKARTAEQAEGVRLDSLVEPMFGNAFLVADGRAGGPPARLIRFRAPRARGCGGAAIRVESGAT